LAARKQPELGERKTFEWRYGPEMPIVGHRRRGDAGSIQLPHFEFLQNVRFDDGIKGRTPASNMLEGIGEQVVGLYDFQCTGPAGRLYVIYEGCPQIATGISGSSMSTFDQEKQTALNGIAYWETSTFGACLAEHDGILYIGRDDGLYAFISIEAAYEDQALFVAGFDQSELLRQFTGFTVTCLRSAFGLLFIGLDDGAGNGEIWTYDGVTYRSDDTGIDPPACMTLFQSKTLVVAFTTSDLRLRDSAGAWTTVAGAVGEADGDVQMCEYRDSLYITEDGADIWKLDGTTLALAIDHSVAGARINGICEAFGFMFFGYESATNEAVIGRLDDAGAYVDVHHNITTQALPDDFSWARLVKQLTFYRGAIVAGVESLLYGGRLFLSQGENTTQPWLIEQPVDVLAPAYGAVIAFSVF
jgi:hypothetical protein